MFSWKATQKKTISFFWKLQNKLKTNENETSELKSGKEQKNKLEKSNKIEVDKFNKRRNRRYFLFSLSFLSIKFLLYIFKYHFF